MSQAKSPASGKGTRKSSPRAKTTRKAPSVDNPGKVLKRSRYSKAESYAIFQRFHADNPEPKGELDYTNAFTLLVAVVLSAQATDVGVNRATRHLFQIADTPQKMVALGEDLVREEIKTIGLYKNKARNVILLSEQLIRDHGGEVPEDRDALEALAGVGRKTANVVLNIFFGHPTIAVDTHLFRLGNRIGIAPGKTPLDVEKAMEKVVPAEFALHAHHWLILHGRYICKARKPECRRCVIYDLCKSPEKLPFDAVPEIALRTKALIEKETAA
ncbi:endonuclease III [Roseibium sp. M-1]